MNVAAECVERAPEVHVDEAVRHTSSFTSLRWVDAIADLTDIFEPHVNLVVLQRVPPPGVVDDAQRAIAQPGFRRFFVTPAATAASVVAAELSGFSHVAADIHFWVEALAELTGCESVGVRLERADAAMCPRFHVDRVTLRLVSTYAGRGTEFVASEHVDRGRLGHASQGLADEVSGLLLRPECIRAARAFDVVLLKGEAWPGNHGQGAVHRSPAATATEPRLVVTLDPLDPIDPLEAS